LVDFPKMRPFSQLTVVLPSATWRSTQWCRFIVAWEWNLCGDGANWL